MCSFTQPGWRGRASPLLPCIRIIINLLWHKSIYWHFNFMLWIILLLQLNSDLHNLKSILCICIHSIQEQQFAHFRFVGVFAIWLLLFMRCLAHHVLARWWCLHLELFSFRFFSEVNGESCHRLAENIVGFVGAVGMLCHEVSSMIWSNEPSPGLLLTERWKFENKFYSENLKFLTLIRNDLPPSSENLTARFTPT